MNQVVPSWLKQYVSLKGLLACGVRYPDETVFILPCAHGFAPSKVEYSLRCMADTLQVLKLNDFPNQYIRWTYHDALFYCLRREDGILLGFFTVRDPDGVDLERLEKM